LTLGADKKVILPKGAEPSAAWSHGILVDGTLYVSGMGGRGTFIVGEAAARTMKETGGGSIVNIASVPGITESVGRSAHGASKWGVAGLSRMMAIDLAAVGIRVNVLAPGAVETPLVDRMLSEEEAKQWTAHTPLHRYARPEEVAGGVVFLCSKPSTLGRRGL
jgi:NAD(P)-dependent dehydrogenase (short-subunit alcohol dehydrogenase family)